MPRTKGSKNKPKPENLENDREDETYRPDFEDEDDEEEIADDEATKVSTQAKKSTASNTSKSTKTTKVVEKVEHIAIKYCIPNSNHPLHGYNEKIDRVPLRDIRNFGTSVSKEDVNKFFE
jgi:hypothetical protein